LSSPPLIPAQAGIQSFYATDSAWVPAFAGTSGLGCNCVPRPSSVHPRASGDPESKCNAEIVTPGSPLSRGQAELRCNCVPRPSSVHPRASGDPESKCNAEIVAPWVPAFAGTSGLRCNCVPRPSSVHPRPRLRGGRLQRESVIPGRDPGFNPGERTRNPETMIVLSGFRVRAFGASRNGEGLEAVGWVERKRNPSCARQWARRGAVPGRRAAPIRVRLTHPKNAYFFPAKAGIRHSGARAQASEPGIQKQ